MTLSNLFCIYLLQNYIVYRCERVAKFCDEQINSMKTSTQTNKQAHQKSHVI